MQETKREFTEPVLREEATLAEVTLGVSVTSCTDSCIPT
jgi:hypothetical protein